MTKLGIGFIVAGVLLYFIANQSQIGWLYLFDAIIWALLVVSAILPWYTLRSLRVEHQSTLPASTPRQPLLGGPLEDETVEVKFKVTNKGRLSRYFIKVLADCPFEDPEKRHKSFLLSSINAGSTTEFAYSATCYKRGHYTSSSTTLQSDGLLGLIARRRTFQLPFNLTIYPSYYRMEGMPIAEAEWAERGRTVKSSTAAEFYGSREYQYGEPLKNIHWRNTARLGRFMLKEFEQANQGLLTVTFGTGHDFGNGKDTTLEYSIKIAASLARLCADSERGINIIAGKAPLFSAAWREAMDYLANLEVDKNKGVTAELAATAVPGQVAVAIVPAIDTNLIPALLHLSSQVQGLVIVLLEGFTTGEIPFEFHSRLKKENVEIISCSRGNLEATIKELKRYLST